MSALLQPTSIGPSLHLRNRIAMSSMTRNRNTDNLKPGPVNIEYYTQRASAGLIITEGILVSHHTSPWPHVPVLYDEAQMLAWAKVADAVHAEGGKIFFQAWHAEKNEGMGLEDVKEAVGLFRRSAELGRRARFDGVEVLAQGLVVIRSIGILDGWILVRLTCSTPTAAFSSILYFARELVTPSVSALTSTN